MNRVVDGDDDNAPEQTSARKAFFPSSMGLSVLVPEDAAQLQVKITWGDYTPARSDDNDPGEEVLKEGDEAGERADRRRDWRRRPRMVEMVVGLEETREPRNSEIPDSDGLKIVVSVRQTAALDLVPPGTRSVSVFLVNHRDPAPDLTRDQAYIFQPD